MRVALVHDWLTGMRGGEKCLEVLCELFPHADLYTLVHRRGSVSKTIESRTVRESWIARLPGGRRHYRWYVPLYPLAIESFDLTGYDLVISTSHCAAKGALTRADTLHVCYCFTPVRYFWDLYPDYFGPGRGSALGRALAPWIAHYFRIWDRVSADRVDLFVADSRHVRARIAKHYRRPARVIYPPVDTAFFTPATIPAGQPDSGTAAAGAGGAAASPGVESAGGAAAPYLVVSALVPYKGVERTIRVANRRRFPLRIVGTGPEENRLRSIAGPTVRFDEWLSMEALRDAYRGSRALIQAHEEDFGIAPLEAMACGRPVIALRKGGAAEVVAAGTGVLFDEATEGGLERAVDEFESRRFNPAEVRRHALGFDRQVYREAMEALLHEAVEAFQRREADPPGLDRLAGACAEQDTVV
ncbi:MAG: glycosyltransferase family 4 protein [Candidatus Eisenbacteria bacterium]|uniref:Glycosyltransferase family 4 protein n=1 Tax=Eiseniibacteriota bacterium TaxID=2212470 RepID=A0A538TJW7_UNCEI|nr:MAG: glycosyltransferase family 4 protein [Candidatus Eisenbacteria bacterium]